VDLHNPQSQDKAMTEAFWKDTQVLGGLFAGLKDPMLALCWISRREYRSHPGNCADFGLSLPEVYMNSSNTIFVQVLDCPCLKSLECEMLEHHKRYHKLKMAVQVLDSPFSRLKDLMVELCEEQKLPIPRAFMRIALSMMRRSVRKRADFVIDDVSPLDVVPGSFIPALFGEPFKCNVSTA